MLIFIKYENKWKLEAPWTRETKAKETTQKGTQ